MVLNFLYFSIKIERVQKSKEQRIATYEQERYLEERAAAHAVEAAKFITRM